MVGVTSPGESFAVDHPERYTLTFLDDDRITLRADCNRGSGPVAISAPGALTIGPLATTRARCLSGLLPPIRSSPDSNDFANESLGQDTSHLSRARVSGASGAGSG